MQERRELPSEVTPKRVKRKTVPRAELPRSRPPLRRMLLIHQALQRKSYPNAARLAREFEISSKSVYRDLDFMRYSLDLPIEWDGARNGFYYTEEVNEFPTMQMSEGELLAMIVAEKALQQYRGTSFERPLMGAIKKLTESLPDTISLDVSDVEQTISFLTRAEPVLNLEVFEALAKGTTRRKQLEITYRKPGQTEPELRVIDPYHLANINGEWFLFAYDHLRKDIRTFVPTRIKQVRMTGKSFPRPERFSLEKRLRGSFGVHSGHGNYQVVLQFTPRVAEYVREKKWHTSQTLKELPGGGLELTMELSGLAEVERWVLSWAGDCRVVTPDELSLNIQNAARRLLNSSDK